MAATITPATLRFAYRAIYLTQDDDPDDRRVWQAASEAEKIRAANQVHAEAGGTVPAWARKKGKNPKTWYGPPSKAVKTSGGKRRASTAGAFVGRNPYLGDAVQSASQRAKKKREEERRKQFGYPPPPRSNPRRAHPVPPLKEWDTYASGTFAPRGKDRSYGWGSRAESVDFDIVPIASDGGRFIGWQAQVINRGRVGLSGLAGWLNQSGQRSGVPVAPFRSAQQAHTAIRKWWDGNIINARGSNPRMTQAEKVEEIVMWVMNDQNLYLAYMAAKASYSRQREVAESGADSAGIHDQRSIERAARELVKMYKDETPAAREDARSNPRNRMTKAQFEAMFKEWLSEAAPEHERDGIPDRPWRRTAWNDTVDMYIKEGELPESAGDWSHPKWLETFASSRASSRRNPGKMLNPGDY